MFASQENGAAAFDHAILRHSFPDIWISDAFARETEALTRALQKSLSHELPPPPSPAPSSGPSSPTSSAPRRLSPPSSVPPKNPIGGKIAKRKSRTSKRSPTTFITADPANFRQMVQQVTGIRLGTSPASSSAVVASAHVLKPEPHRAGGPVQVCLPTLDTSAFLLDHHHQQVLAPAEQPPASVASQVSFAPECSSGLDFDSPFPAFPTLESWRVM